MAASHLWEREFSCVCVSSTPGSPVPHQEINASPDKALLCVVARSGQEAIVVNLAVEGVDNPEEMRWVDGLHR